MIKISIIIPVYNVEDYLRQCLNSVVNQTLCDIEIICIDDGSTDGSAAILSEYASKDSRIKVLLHEHTNAGAARNAGMAVATGEYLGFVDSDDWCESTLFEKAYAKAKDDDADVVFWRYVQYDVRTQKNSAPRVFPKEMLTLGMPFSPEDIGGSIFSPITYAPWGKIVRRSLVAAEDLKFQEIVRTNDVYFYCMVSAFAKRQSVLDEVLYTYRVGTGRNLQAHNAASPDSVFSAWKLVASELEKRGVIGKFKEALMLASANSLTYTLNTISSTQGYVDFFCRLRNLYLNDLFYSTINLENISNHQTATYIKLLRENETPLDFLVKQENYYRERLALEYWTRVGAQRTNGELQRTLKDCRDRIAKFELEKETQKRAMEQLTAEKKALMGKVSLLARTVDEFSKKCDTIQREKLMMEQSVSFRLGRYLTWFPRRLRAAMRHKIGKR